MSGSTREGISPYLVLLQDCLAIKFVPLVSSLSYHHSKNKIHHSNSNANNHRVHIRSGVSVNGDRDGDQCCETANCTGISKDANVNAKSSTPAANKCSSSHPPQCSLNPCQKSASLPHYFHAHTSTATSKKNHASASTANVDHSVHGLFLYKEFVQVNLQCFWNDAVYETFSNLEYKGYVVPSTILVTSASSRYLNVLRTAWSRKMIHSVSGYRIEFIGEIEEMIADPIQKSHFVPLADTLCWAIYEITSSGREAFVDEILTELCKTFETMVQPSRELVYETLEKLTRGKKVYQTAQGYFVVTPDTYRYIISCDEPSLMNKAVDTCAAPAVLLPTMKPQELQILHTVPGNASDDISNHNSERKKSLLLQSDSSTPLKECDNDNRNNTTTSFNNDDFKRSSSLKFFPRKEHSSGKFSRSRSLSLRLPRNKKNDADSQIEKDMKNLKLEDEITGSKTLLNIRKAKGTFLSRLLNFRRSTTKNKKIITASSTKPVGKRGGSMRKMKNVQKEICTQSMSTQTSLSIENMNELSSKVRGNVSSANNISTSTSTAAEDSDSGRYTESSSSDAEIAAALAGSPILSTKANDVADAPERKDELELTPGWSINDPMYEKLRSQSQYSHSSSQFSLVRHDTDAHNSSELIPMSNKSNSVSDCERPTSVSPTKDYCKSSNSSSSPCPSTSISDRSTSSLSSYRDLYNFYRRRHPTYHQQQQQQSSNVNSSTKKQNVYQLPTNPPSSSTSRQKLNDVRRHSFRKVFPLKKPTTNTPSPTHSAEPSSAYKFQSNSETSGNCSTNSTTTTTTVTQTVKSDSNVELELLLPLEKLINAALLAQREKSGEKKTGEATETKSGGLRTEMVTNVNDLFSIRSHVSISPDDAMSSTIEIKTNNSVPKKQSISVKPSSEFREDCRESEII